MFRILASIAFAMVLNAHAFAEVEIINSHPTTNVQVEDTPKFQGAGVYGQQIFKDDPGFHKATAVWQEHNRAIHAADLMGLQGVQREEYVKLQTDNATEKYLGLDLKDVPAVVLLGTVADKSGGGRVFDYLVKQANENLPTDMPKDSRAANGLPGRELIEAAADRGHPQHQFAMILMKKIYNWDPNRNFTSQPGIAESLRQDELKRIMGENFQTMMDFLNSKKLTNEQSKQLNLAMQNAVKVGMKEESERLAKLQKAVESRRDEIRKLGRNSPLWTSLTDQEKADFYSYKIDQGNKALKAVGNVARIVGEPELAAKAGQMIDIWNGVDKAVSVSLTTSFGKDPFSFINAYAGVGMALMSFFGSDDSASNPMFELLQTISKQIRELHREMILRFDLLDSKLKSQFELTMTALDAIHSQNGVMSEKLDRLKNQIDNLNREVRNGFRLTWTLSEARMGFCSRTGLGEEQFRECRDYYAAMATQIIPAEALARKDVADQTTLELSSNERRHFYEKLREAGLSPVQPPVHPATWEYAGEKILQLFEANPRFSPLAKEKNVQWNIPQMIQNGNASVRAQESLLLFKSTGSEGYTLKKEVLTRLINQYRDAAELWIEDGRTVSDAAKKGGPNPMVGYGQDPHEHNHRFYKSNIGFCSDVKDKKVGISGKQAWINEAEDRTIERNFSLFDEKRVHSGPQFLGFIPPRMRWASIMGESRDLKDSSQFAQVDIIPCFREISIPDFRLHQKFGGMHYQIKIVLEFHLTYKVYGKEKIDILISRATLDEKGRNGNLDININNSAECSFFHRYWSSPAVCPYGGYTRNDWVPLSQDLSRFKIEFIDSPEVQRFDAYMEDFRRKAANRAERDFKKISGVSSLAEVEVVDERRALQLAVFLGLDPENHLVQGLNRLLSTDSGLPSQATLKRAAFESDKTPDQIMEVLNGRIAVVEQIVEQLAKAKDLRPRQQRAKKSSMRSGGYSNVSSRLVR